MIDHKRPAVEVLPDRPWPTRSRDDAAVDAMVMVMSSMRKFAEDYVDEKINRVHVQRWLNVREHLRTLFGIFEWRYLLLPVGVRALTQRYQYGTQIVFVTTKSLHVFGVRLARWVTETKGAVEIREPRVPLKKYGLRRRRNR